MCWGIFPFLVPCLSRGVIWADSEQPVRVKYVSNRSCGLFKDRVSCVLGLLLRS
ncbi:mCG148084 [Mus musculus]|nr:mCG148084 [Mus musculus]